MRRINYSPLLGVLTFWFLAACSGAGPTPTPMPDVERLFAALADTCTLFGETTEGVKIWLGECGPDATPEDVATETATTEPSATATDTPEPTPTDTETPEPTPTDTATAIPVPPSATPAGTPIAAYPDAPLCPDHGDEHDPKHFHTLWDSARGCHYDHTHGTNPFTPDVAAAFPGFDLYALLGNVQIGHTNPSSPAENVAKHGGFKWDVNLSAPDGCAVGFEGGTVAVDAYAIQYHAFGPQAIEFEARNHSTAALLRQCKPGDPADKGYVYVTQLQEYGERCLIYQGATLDYPDNFQPEWDCAFGPYFTTEGFGNCEGCRPSLAFYTGVFNRNNLTVWSSKPTGQGARPPTPILFRLLFRARDAYMSLDASDLVHPFTWRWACGGTAYNPVGCRYNNSTTRVQEVAGDIPASMDNLAGWDTDPRLGRVTAEGFVNQFGQPTEACLLPGIECYVFKAVSAFVGRYSSDLCLSTKCANPTPLDTPEHDLYFCGGVPCAETDAGAVPSGWIGPSN